MSTHDDRQGGAHAASGPSDGKRRTDETRQDGTPYDSTRDTARYDDQHTGPLHGTGPSQDRDHDGVPDSVDRHDDRYEGRDRDRDRGDRHEGRDRDHDGVPDRVDRHDDRYDERDRDRDGVPDRVDRHDDRTDDRGHGTTAAAAGGGAAAGALSARSFGRDRETVVAREREEFGGMKFGAAFFGWLTAMGTAVILTALAAAIGTALGLGTDTSPEEAVNASAETVGWAGAVVLLVIILVAYFAGGYVAGRMARFDGAKQGIAVWLWALVIAIAVAVLGLVAGAEFNVLADMNAFPRIPVNEGDLTTVGIVVALIVAVAALAGAVLGGITGMRYHRRVDRVGLGA
ncbi:TIGR04086 family membrane protein [Actinotalea sp. Marseille-Q4924]|uniref:TIGR04086 family membrane protein n=1 Tax=Actinotalea sp. Marseille-Q4924 TaxID=2866571 RepID=UPI00351D95B0